MTDTLPPLPPGFQLDEDVPDSANRNPPATYPGAAQMIADATPPPPPGFELDPHPDDVQASAGAGFNPDGSLDIVGAPAATAPAADNPANHGQFAGLITGQAPQRDTLDELGHQFSYQGRDFLSGAASVLGLVNDPIAAGMEKLGLSHGYRAQELATMAADALHLDKPENAQERVLGDVQRALGSTATGVGVGRTLAQAANPVVSGVGNFFAMQPGAQIVSGVGGATAGGITREEGGTQGQQLAATLAGSIGPQAAGALGSATVRGVLRGGEAGRKAVADQINNFAAIGETPTVGQATQAWRNQAAENLLAAAPTSGGVVSRRAAEQGENIGEALRQRAAKMFPGASSEVAGRKIEQGVGQFANNVKATRKALYWVADQLMPGNTPIATSNTQQTLARLTTPNPGARQTTEALINPKFADLAQRIQADIAATGGKGLPYEAIKDVRSRIGEALSDYSLTTDKPTAEYKALYAALSKDMEAAARAAGPEASAAMKRASNYFKASQDRLDMIERVVDREGGPERVFNAAMAGTRDGATVLRSVMRSLPNDGKRAVTAAVLKRMGLANPNGQNAATDAFSASTFLTRWNELAPEARQVLFSSHGPRFANDMERVAKAVETIKTGSKVYQNPSGTAGNTLAYGYASGLAGSAASGHFGLTAALLAGGAGANISARLMTSPKFVRWLAHTTTMPAGALPQAVTQLRNIAASEQGDDKAEILGLADEMERAHQRPKDEGGNGQ